MAYLYETAIKLSYIEGGALKAISAIVAQLARGTGEVAKFEKALGGLKVAAWGAAGAFAGFEGLKGPWDLAKGSKELLDRQEQLRRAGVSNLDVLRLTADAYDKVARAVPTASASEFLATVKELRAVTGTAAGAEALAPKALMVDALLSNTFGKEIHGDYYKLLRSAEMKGISTDPKKLEQMTDAAFSYITAFGGKLTAQDFQTFARRGGTAWMNMKPESFGPAAVAMADLGGSAAGTAMMTLQQLQQGAMTLSKQQGATLEKAGLLDMSKTTKTGFGGGRLQLEPGAILGSLQYAGDLPGWIKNVVYPHMMAAAGGNEALFQNMLGKEAPNRNAAKMIEMFGNKGFRDQIAKDLGLAGQVLPIGQSYQSYVNTNPVGVEAAYEAQKKSMLQAIGAPIMQAAIPVMKAITTLFEKIGALANANPGAVARLAEGISLLSVTLIGAGGAAMIAALGPAGWITAGVIATGGAFLMYKDPIVAGFEALKTGLVDLGKVIDKFTKIGFDWLADKLNALGDAIMNIVNKIRSFIPISYGGAGVGGGGIIKTSYGGAATGLGGGGGHVGGGHVGGGGGLGLGNLPLGSPGSNPILQAIHSAAGGDSRVERLMRNIYASESGHGGHWDLGDYGAAGGPFELNTAGGRMGAVFQRTHPGMSVHDPRTLQAQAGFVASWLKHHPGVNPANVWFGLRHPERFGHLTGGYRPGTSLPPSAKHGPATHIHNTIHLDGKIIARSTSKHLANHAQYATSVGRQDGRGTFMGPGAEVFA